MEPRRVLVHERIDANRRATRNLLVVFALACLPAAAYLSVYFSMVAIVFAIVAMGSLSAATGLANGNVAVWLVVVPTLAALIVLPLPLAAFHYSAALMLRLSRARPADAQSHPELWRTVENLCIGAGLPMPRLHVIESRSANAFSSGLNPATSSLVVTSGLLQLLQRRELEGVLAHELVQIANYDTRLATVLAAVVAFLRLPFTTVTGFFRFFFHLHWTIGWFMLLYMGLPVIVGIPFGLVFSIALIGDGETAAGYATLGGWCVAVYSLFLAPLIAEVLRSTVIRRRHFLADADAVLLTRNAEPLAIALTKMTAAGGLEFSVALSTAHLWTVDPRRDRGFWGSIWPGSHPPVSERVSLLAGMSSGILQSHFDQAIAAGEAFAGSVGAEPGGAPPGPEADEVQESTELEEAIAFRLAASTYVYVRPDATSQVIDKLPAGALITVCAVADRFLHVITPGERFGYIAEDTPREPARVPSLSG
ncbi:MAG TPA: M48 family metalloprotease [Dehalococcoidia bacterium]|nr:M48 family metalloprotease [Dehalococcoidia bacterium]